MHESGEACYGACTICIIPIYGHMIMYYTHIWPYGMQGMLPVQHESGGACKSAASTTVSAGVRVTISSVTLPD